MPVRFLVLILGVAAITAVSACGDPLATKASVNTIEDTAAVFALTGAPQSGPTAINTFVPAAVPTIPSQHPDVIFDIRDGVAYALPPKAVGNFGNAGFQRATQPYDAITQAPVSGYNDSTPLPIQPGDVFLVQSLSFACSAALLQERLFIYSKIVVDSIFYDTVAHPESQIPRTIYYRMRVDPNCGFLSFADGLPSF